MLPFTVLFQSGMIQAALAIVVVTLIKFNYAQTSSCVEKNLEDSLLMS